MLCEGYWSLDVSEAGVVEEKAAFSDLYLLYVVVRDNGHDERQCHFHCFNPTSIQSQQMQKKLMILCRRQECS